jgi:restriction system protein
MIKMAQNSLFAVLLRSPWWISVAIALTFVVLSKLLLPDNLWIYGAFGGLAFIVIGGIAFVKQWHLPSQTKVDAVTTKLANMSWREFAIELEKAFIRDGYIVKKIEGEADFLITRAGRVGVVSAKRWKAAQHSHESVMSLNAFKDKMEARDCILIALGQLSDPAKDAAKKCQVQVLQGQGLTQMLSK